MMKFISILPLLLPDLMRDLNITDGSETPVPLANINSQTLGRVLQWADYHKYDPPVVFIEEVEDENTPKRTDDICTWDANFLKIGQKPLFELILAANYLEMKPLMATTCKTVANMIKGKTLEEMKKTFNIQPVPNPRHGGVAAANGNENAN